MNKKALFQFIVIVLCMNVWANISLSQNLARKAWLGAKITTYQDSNSKCNGKPFVTGACINEVLAGSSAEMAKLKINDLLLSINGIEIRNYNSVSEAMSQIYEGDNLVFKVKRDGKLAELKTKAIARPFEVAENGEVIYEAVPFKGGYIRTITNKPLGNEKRPAIFFVQGYTCVSIDNLSSSHPYKKLIEGLVAKGYVVMRMEKPGMGDCKGTPDCFSIDINTENEAFSLAYLSLKTKSYVDTGRMIIFGHSLGGITAPIIANQLNPKGVIVYGTTCEPWYEYLLKMLRYQNPLFSGTYNELEEEMKVYQSLLYEHFVLRKPPAELVKNKDYNKLLTRDFQLDDKDGMLGRHYTFWLSVNDLDLTEAWSKINSNVLAIYGEADIEALESEPTKRIADIVNHYHPGKATFKLLEGTDHAFLKTGSKEKDIELKLSGEIRNYYSSHFNYEVVDLIDKWILETIK